MNPIICTRIPLPDPALVAEAAKYALADLHESLGAVQGRMALMSSRMRPLLQGRRISGAAVTSYNFPGDNLMIHVALNVAERGQITLPKAVRDALGLTKGTQLKVELDGGRIILRKNVDDALSRLRGRFKLAEGYQSTDEAMRAIRGRAPGDPYLPAEPAKRARPAKK